MPVYIKLGTCVFACMLLLTASCSWAAAETATVVIDGEPLVGEVSPVRRDGQTLVPLRSLARALDAEVSWKAETGEIILETGPWPLAMRPGEKSMQWAGQTIVVDTPPVVRDGRTFVSLELLADWLGLPLLWDARENTAHMHTGRYGRQESPTLYRALALATDRHIPSVVLSSARTHSPRLMVDNLTRVGLDHPEFIHLGPALQLENGRLRLDFAYTPEQRAEMERDMEQATRQLLAQHLQPGMSLQEQMEAVHDALARETTYGVTDGEGRLQHSAHTAYGVLVERRGVCSGYAAALKLLLDQAGVENVIVTGSVHGMPHAWNLVQIEGQYRHVDATWNSAAADEEGLRRFFGLNDEAMAHTHTWDREAYPPAP